MNHLDHRVQNYWSQRAHDFFTVRRNELSDPISQRWLKELFRFLPKGRPLNILDVGTGSGYFAILLAQLGHTVTGIDLTPAMLEEARRNAADYQVSVRFLEMDAQRTNFPDSSFDAVLSRNLTWTLPEPDTAYRDWFRVLKPGGVLLNFDADYASNVRHQNQRASAIAETEVYGHCGITPALEQENAAITLSMPASEHLRPQWDIQQLRQIGFSSVGQDAAVGTRILRERDLDDAPMFLVWGIR